MLPYVNEVWQCDIEGSSPDLVPLETLLHGLGLSNEKHDPVDMARASVALVLEWYTFGGQPSGHFSHVISHSSRRSILQVKVHRTCCGVNEDNNHSSLNWHAVQTRATSGCWSYTR